jgi:DNA polymerase-3 subunit epsilon
MERAREELFADFDGRNDGIESGEAEPSRPRFDGAAALFERLPHAGAKEKLRAFLEARPAGADAHELIRLLFKGVGSDPDLGARLVDGILGGGGDPNFIFDAATGLWSLRSNEALRAPLDDAHFVVVDLETTGGRPAPGAIIEIGAYRMRGRRILDSFQSLIRPRMRIPRFVIGLTSITNEMVADAPPIEDVLPAFRDFLGHAVMVAHNAQFDRSFLDFEFRRLFGIGLLNPVLCTVRMARRFLPSVKRRRLDLLADHFGLSTAGRHRGLGDARMAAELLSIFLEMAAGMGINRLDRLIDHHYRGMTGRRIERHVPPETIAAMPRTPGVYLMRNERGDLLYIGKAARLKDRVASYFTGGASLNAKTAELVSHAWSIETRPAHSALEAALVEARLIRELKPPYNRMLKSAAPAYFLRIDQADPFPRIQVARKLSHKAGMLQIGPFIGRRNLDNSARALSRMLGLRVCAGRLEPDEDFSPCVYGQMGHCTSPCNATITRDEYARQAARAIAFLRGRGGPLMGGMVRARDDAAASMRFEEARRWHRDLEALAALSDRAERLSRVVTENNLVIVTAGDAAYVVLSGRLALARDLASRAAAEEIAAFVAANFDRYRLRPIVRGELEEMAIVARWLKERAPGDGRLIHLDGPFVSAEAILAAGARQGS